MLPQSILWRKKEAFSDGVSGTQNSWHTVIQNHVNTIITDNEYNFYIHNFKRLNTPISKEGYYYRKLFDEIYPYRDNIIPHFWMPKWTNTQDPSAREL